MKARTPAARAAAASPYGHFSGKRSATYVANAETVEIVNLAIRLGRPLLVEGEAGCGKTRLAAAIADELGLQGEAFVSATVKSTSQAKDLLYRFDALLRLQDVQRPRVPAQDEAAGIDHRDPRYIYPYIQFEPLGHAIRLGQPSLVLIDEVDKADIDFPNDLLDVLDRFEFDIEDLPRSESALCQQQRGFGRHVQPPAGGVRPIVVVTSNREKQLPEPFLRRCLYLQLAFPEDDVDLLCRIVQKNLGGTPDQVSQKLIAHAVDSFCQVRKRGRQRHVQKLPATSELVDWVRVLHWQQRSADAGADALTAADLAVLFKLRQDSERMRARSGDEAAA